MKNLLQTLLLILALAIPALAQKPETKAADKPVAAKPAPPAEIKFTEEQAKETELLGTRLQLAEERTKNAKLLADQAQDALKQQQGIEAQLRANFQQFLSDTALRLGVPKEELPDWTIDASGPVPILKKKAKPEPKPEATPKQ